MTNMLKFLKRKIKPFKKCTGNPSYSFEADTTVAKQISKQDYTSSYLDTNDFTGFSQTKLDKRSRSGRFTYFRFKRTKKDSMSSGHSNNSLNNREATNSLAQAVENGNEDNEIVHEKAVDPVVFDTPTSSLGMDESSYDNMQSSENDEWGSRSYAEEMPSYTDEDCIQDLIDHTNFSQDYLRASPGINSMVTYNTRYANNSNILMDEDGLKQSTPFDELNSSLNNVKNRNIKRTSKVLSELGNVSGVKKSGKFQNRGQLLLQAAVDSPLVFKKTSLKPNRKCRRSNTTFTMAGGRKNKIIDYFNNLELTKKPISKSTHRLFRSTNEIVVRRPQETVKSQPLLDETKNESVNESGLSQSKNEIEKIQDLFFYDESMMSGRSENPEENLMAESNQHILSTFLDSPISVVTEKSNESAEITPMFKNQTNFVKIEEMTSTNNSLEKFRRSSSMPGLNEPNLSIQANNSKLTALKGFDDEFNMNIITPKKALNFDQNDLASNTLDTPSTPVGHYISSFEVCDDELKTSFVRGEPRNLSKNIKQMFKNVIKLQLDALSNLEKFYEAQLLKVEDDRQQNLQMNPMNRTKINEFFDKQLELLEERVQVNLEYIVKDKNKKMNSSTSLKFEQVEDESSDESIQKTSKSTLQKQLFSQKLAQIISSSQNCNNNGLNRRSQSKNLLDLKNNLINQKSLLPSKILSNQSTDYSPKTSSIFKRNLSLPFKQCKQNFCRVRNESVHETILIKTNPIASPPRLAQRKQVNESEFSYNKNQYQKNTMIKYGQSNEDVRKIQECSVAKIVKLNKADTDKRAFVVSANSAFKPIKKAPSNTQLFASHDEAYEEIEDNMFKPSSLDVRRNSSIFYNNEINEMNIRRNMPLPRLSDSHLLFKIKQEKRLNDKKIVSTYQKQFQSKVTQNLTRQVSNFRVETEV